MNSPFDVVGKLMLTREMTFGKGEINLLGTRMVLSNAALFSEFIKNVSNSEEILDILYKSAKVTFRDDMSKNMGKKFGFTFNDFFKWLPDVAMLAGWGKLSWGDLDEKLKRGIIFVEDSPIADNLKGIAKKPVDHLIRGFIAGGASASLQVDIDVVEEECLALGKDRCKFIFKPALNF